MVLIPAIMGGISLLTTAVQIQQQNAAAANQARGAAFTAEMQRINSRREIELDKINTEKQKQVADRMLELNQQGRTIEALQSSHDYRKAMVQLGEQAKQQRFGLQQIHNQAETAYLQQRAALDKYDSDIRRAYQQNNYNLRNQLYQTELAARAEYELGKQQARIDHAGNQFALREEFVEGNQQYQTARYNLVQQAQGASRQQQQAIGQQLQQLDQMAFEAQSAYDALALRGQGDSNLANATAAQAARTMFQGNQQIAQMNDEDITNYASQVRIADLTAQLGITEEELGIALGLEDEMLGERLRSLETLNDVFQTYFPAIEEHSINALEQSNRADQLGAEYQRTMLENQRQQNRIGYRANLSNLGYNEALARNTIQGQFEADRYQRRLANYTDQLNTLYVKDNLGTQAAANRSAANSRNIAAQGNAVAAARQQPGFFSTLGGALPGLAQAGMYGYQAYQQASYQPPTAAYSPLPNPVGYGNAVYNVPR